MRRALTLFNASKQLVGAIGVATFNTVLGQYGSPAAADYSGAFWAASMTAVIGVFVAVFGID